MFFSDSDFSNDENLEYYEKNSDDEFDLHSDKSKLGTTINENESFNFKM